MSNLSSAASSRKVRNKMAEFSFGNPQREPIRSEMTLEEMDKPREGSRAALIAGGRLNEISEGPFRIQCQEYYRESLAVTRAVWQLVDAAVKNAKIGDAEITSAKIGNGEVQNANIGNAAITNAKIGSLAVSEAKIADLAVSEAKIQDLAVSTAKIDNLAITNAKISTVSADKITAGTINLTSTGYLAAPYGGIKIGYLRTIGGTPIYGLQAGPGHGLMLDDGANGYARMWVDDSGSRPLCIDTTVNDRIFFKASSGNDIMRLYGDNAWDGGHVDIMTSLRIGTNQPSSPVAGEMYWETSPSGMGTGGRLMIYNGFSWHGVAWFSDI